MSFSNKKTALRLDFSMVKLSSTHPNSILNILVAYFVISKVEIFFRIYVDFWVLNVYKISNCVV